jgi:hypothetical protein
MNSALIAKRRGRRKQASQSERQLSSVVWQDPDRMPLFGTQPGQ